MKHTTKLLSLALALLMLTSVFTVLPITTGAVTIETDIPTVISGDYEYRVLADGTAEITNFDHYPRPTEIEIPGSIDGHIVTSIAKYAFWHSIGLENVTIPDTVTNIGSDAFGWCEELTSITIPDSVTSIGENAFVDCTSLKKITIGKGITSIDHSVFSGCTSLETVTIPENITSIGETAFSDCTGLTSVTIPDSVTSLGEYAFDGCTSLKSVIISKNLKTISWGAFKDCTSLTSVTIPEGVERLEPFAFMSCTSLTNVTIPKSVTALVGMTLGYYTYEEERIDPESGLVVGGTSTTKRMENFTITGYSGTEAEWYARISNVPFISLDKPAETKPAETTPTTKPAETKPASAKKTTITLKSKPNSLYVKQKDFVKVKVENGKGKTTYKSSNKKIAKINSNGKITALKKGTVTITIKNNGASRKCVVKVKNPKLNRTRKSVLKGLDFNLLITGGVGTPKFTSNNEKVATVDNNGHVRAKKKGIAIITVKTNGMKLHCTIKVKK